MNQKLEITLVPATTEAAKAFVADLDHQISELDQALTLAKTLRGAVARTFGFDRREGATPLQQVLDSASRSVNEISEEELARELALPQSGAVSRAAQ